MNSREAARLLGVGDDASAEEIKAAFRAKAKTAHPDTGGTDEQFKALKTAQEVMSTRAKYKQSGNKRFGYDPGSRAGSSHMGGVPFDDLFPDAEAFEAFFNVRNERLRQRKQQQQQQSKRAFSCAVDFEANTITLKDVGSSRGDLVMAVPEELAGVVMRWATSASEGTRGGCATCLMNAHNMMRPVECPSCGRVG